MRVAQRKMMPLLAPNWGPLFFLDWRTDSTKHSGLSAYGPAIRIGVIEFPDKRTDDPGLLPIFIAVRGMAEKKVSFGYPQRQVAIREEYQYRNSFRSPDCPAKRNGWGSSEYLEVGLENRTQAQGAQEGRVCLA